MLSTNSKTYLVRVCGLRYRRRMPGEVGPRFAFLPIFLVSDDESFSAAVPEV